MALLGSAISGEVGLRLLLCPLGSNVVIRTACCSVGVVLPVYSTFKAIERNDQNEQKRWLLYWAVYGSFSLAEVFADKILSCVGIQNNFFGHFLGYSSLFVLWNAIGIYFWRTVYNFSTVSIRNVAHSTVVPLYYHMKFAFLVWLQLPSTEGARQMYENYLRPFLLQHQARLDQILGFTYGEMNKFISAHQSEIQFARAVIVKLLASANQVVHTSNPRGHRAIEGPTRQTEDSDRDLDD